MAGYPVRSLLGNAVWVLDSGLKSNSGASIFLKAKITGRYDEALSEMLREK